MSKLNIGQDWSIVTDAANNRLLVEYEPNGNRYALGEDGTLKPLDGDLDLDGGALSNVDWANSDAGSGSGLDADTVDGDEPSNMNVNDADTVDGKHANDLGKSTDEIQEDSMIHNDGFAPGFGG